MTFLPLLIVGAIVIWIRFDIGGRIREVFLAAITLILIEHGTKTLFNGTPAKTPVKPFPNRAYRREQRWKKLHGR